MDTRNSLFIPNFLLLNIGEYTFVCYLDVTDDTRRCYLAENLY